jgi:prepilin signal peptidase PulO-like enzyme (type II secretory pathway)
MFLKSWRFITIMLTAAAFAAALAHLMELPGKMEFDARLYVLLHRTLYPTFGQTAGWAEGLALFSVIGLAWRVRKRGTAFPLTVVAAVCQATAMIVFLVYVYPANVTMSSWPLDSIPAEWTDWRDQWEYAHAARAILFTVALAAQVLGVVWETPKEAALSRAV